ncbi:T-cell surface glycoprotein CD3 delta chain-like [Terrapene carolina triunguis]|uniref:T-cell surface glycoprotein CD3 delta chain-like n=1 Tax=Terrapene triunguis TaxID=2587831 RepID=A0A674ILU2_9SAUR|nr:T-cell surface glycoprotein CD3 delta chain-like [Terrapene carolina triunguis]
MGRLGYLVSVITVGFIIKGVVTQDKRTKASVKVESRGRDVVLKCEGFSGTPSDITWKRDGITVANNSTELNLGAEADDPRGVYMCNDGSAVQVYFRMCQNCIELDAATISGIVVADVIATVFLAIAVYCITGQDSGRRLRASDRQNLIANEQLYQPLGERDNEQYSRLGVTRTRK